MITGKTASGFSTVKILASNLSASEEKMDGKTIVVSFIGLVKCGWEHLDNSTIMLLRLLDKLGISEIAIAGFDGYGYSGNYVNAELSAAVEDPISMNSEIGDMLTDYMATRSHKETKIYFITPSRFESCLEGKK